MQIHVVVADITDLTVDALVVPANSSAVMGAGVAGAVRRKGGLSVEQEARASAPIAVGAAIVTSGGDLFARHVIHAPTMEEPGSRVGVENVRRATHAALLAAASMSLQTIAFPGMGTGVGGVPLDEAARAMVDEIRVHKQPAPSTIYLVAMDEELRVAFESSLRNAQQ